MKSIHTLMTLVSLFTLGACSAESPESTPAGSTGPTGLTQEELNIMDCQKQVTACTLAAKSFQDFGKCTADLQACTSQAALDLVGQGNVLSDCRSKANTCLKGAVTVSDISSCREIFTACSSDVAGAADQVLSKAVKTAEDAISKASDIATGVISGAGGAVGKALDAVGACETQANACLKSVTKMGDVTPCEQTFTVCADKAISIVSTVTDVLPIPPPSQVVSDLSACQTQSTTCLKGAVTVSDVSACRGVLQTCVKGAGSVIDGVISGVTQILPLPVKLPGVGQTVDCTTNLSECLLKLSNPIDCAAQAQACETK
jgi:hypothetical protein